MFQRAEPAPEVTPYLARWASRAVVAVAIIYALYRSIGLAWVCDDAFITYRYADNLVNGHGLVFNVGERVEGYTSFLWTVLLAVGRLIGLEPITYSQILSIGAYILTAILLSLFSYRYFATQGYRSSPGIPVAALSIFVMHDYHIWATSGMETSLAGFLITVTACALLSANGRRQFMLAGLAATAALLTRPEALICLLATGLFVLLARPSPWRTLGYYIMPVAAIYLPYWILRYFYYGYPFPNTYYAKSGYLAYWSQGWKYLALFLKSYYVFLLFLPAAVWLLIRFVRQNKDRLTRLDMSSRTGLLAAMIVIPYALYVVRVGGDFMFARFFIPIVSLCFLSIEAALTSLPMAAIKKTVLGLIIVLMTWASIDRFDPPTKLIDGIVNERVFYPRQAATQAKIDGLFLRWVFTGIDSVTVAFYGTKAMLMYYAQIPVAVEANAGLTDQFIAHLPLAERGRPGHEKKAPYEYLQKRRVLFSFQTWPDPDYYKRIGFGSEEAAILRWDNRVMDRLRNFPEVSFVHFPSYLDEYIERIEERPDSLIRQDLEGFKHYYFNFNSDPERLEKIVYYLRD